MIFVTCGHCAGCGSVELTGETLLTYYALLAAGECHAVALAAEMGCKAHRDDIDWREHGHNVG